MKSRELRLLLSLLALPGLAKAADVGLPLPDAPVRVVIPDVAAFDAALTGAYRRALTGRPEDGDPLVKAWRPSPVGTKLEVQWTKLARDLPWTWEQILRLKPRAVGLALLAVGQLEAVMVVDTPLAALPLTLPPGTTKTHAGAPYQLVAPGAADGSPDVERRMGLAWARAGERLLLATSERALKLALDEALAGRAFAPPLPGLVSLELNLDELTRDRFFRREFLFGAGEAQGRLRAALRLEQGQLVEHREGRGEARASGFVFEAPGAAASGWEPEVATLWPALRAALLEPIPRLEPFPVRKIRPLPAIGPQQGEDRYLVNLEKPAPGPGAPPWEEGELALWKELWAREPVAGWGYLLGADGTRALVFPWPAARDQQLFDLCRATAERRSGRAAVVAVGDAREIRVGPELPALALRRRGAFVWIGPTAKALAGVPTPEASTDLIRWARVDLNAVRAESARWERAEGPASPEQVRPLSDRILGLLGWMPSTTSISVERRRTPDGWAERVVFGGAPR